MNEPRDRRFVNAPAGQPAGEFVRVALFRPPGSGFFNSSAAMLTTVAPGGSVTWHLKKAGSAAPIKSSFVQWQRQYFSAAEGPANSLQ